jgi:hypothetical protein
MTDTGQNSINDVYDRYKRGFIAVILALQEKGVDLRAGAGTLGISDHEYGRELLACAGALWRNGEGIIGHYDTENLNTVPEGLLPGLHRYVAEIGNAHELLDVAGLANDAGFAALGMTEEYFREKGRQAALIGGLIADRVAQAQGPGPAADLMQGVRECLKAGGQDSGQDGPYQAMGYGSKDDFDTKLEHFKGAALKDPHHCCGGGCHAPATPAPQA